MTTKTMNPIFILLDGKPNGPYDLEEVGRLLTEEKISSSALAWHEGLPEWVLVKTLLHDDVPNTPLAPQLEPLDIPKTPSPRQAPTTPAQIDSPQERSLPNTPPVMGKPKPTFPRAGLSLALGLLSLTILLGFVGLPAAILGLVGLSRLRAAHKTDGRGKCVTGIVTGCLGFLAFSLVIASIIFDKQIAKLTDSASKAQLLAIEANDPANLPLDINVKWDVDAIGSSGNINVRSGTKAQVIDVTDNGVVAIINDKTLVTIPVWATDALDNVNQGTSPSPQSAYVGTWILKSNTSVPGMMSLDMTLTLDLNADGTATLDGESEGTNVAIPRQSEVSTGHWQLTSDGNAITTDWDTRTLDLHGSKMEDGSGNTSGPIPDDDPLKHTIFNIVDQDTIRQSTAQSSDASYIRTPSLYEQNESQVNSYLSNRGFIEGKIGSLSTLQDDSLGSPSSDKLLIIKATRKCFDAVDKSLGKNALIPKPLLLRASLLLSEIGSYTVEKQIQDFEAACINHDITKAESLLTDINASSPNDPQLPSYSAKLQQAKFEVAAKAFQTAVQNGDITDSLSKLSEAKALSANDPSIPSLQEQLANLETRLFQSVDKSLSTGDISEAGKELTELSSGLPGDARLTEYKSKLTKFKFSAATKSFNDAIQSQNIDGASTLLEEAIALMPDDPSLDSLRSTLAKARFLKGSDAFKSYITSGRLSDARDELNKLQTLNINPAETAALATQLSGEIKTTIASILNRGRDALRSNDIDAASQASADATALDPTNPLITAFQSQINDAKYKAAVAEALRKVNSNDWSDAQVALQSALANRPDDLVGSQAAQKISDLLPILGATEFSPDSAISSHATGYLVQQLASGNVRLTATVTGQSPQGNRARGDFRYVSCDSGSGAGSYQMAVYLPDDIPLPANGTSISMVGKLTCFNPMKAGTIISIKVWKLLPPDFISEQTSAIKSLLQKALSGSVGSSSSASTSNN